MNGKCLKKNKKNKAYCEKAVVFYFQNNNMD